MSGHRAGIYRQTQPLIDAIKELTGARPTMHEFRYSSGHTNCHADVHANHRWYRGQGPSRRVALARLLADITQDEN